MYRFIFNSANQSGSHGMLVPASVHLYHLHYSYIGMPASHLARDGRRENMV